jgi:hypothetical protein
MPTVRGLGALLLIALLGTACAASGASPSANASQSAAGSAPASLAAASASAASASAASASAVASGIGLPDGIYTAGHLSAKLTGLVTEALDLPLQTAGSMTAHGSTQLTYQSEHGAQMVTIALAADGPITITFVGSNVTAAGISAVGCSITISHADSSGLSGSIDCHALTAINASGSVVGTIDLKGTFDATR